jgi:hypothetical protein
MVGGGAGGSCLVVLLPGVLVLRFVLKHRHRFLSLHYLYFSRIVSNVHECYLCYQFCFINELV